MIAVGGFRPRSERTPWYASRRSPLRIALAGALLLVSFGVRATAAPQAHILRIDPRTSVLDGDPVLTTVIDLSEGARIGEVTASCGALRGEEQLSCMSDSLEKTGALATSVPFPEKDVHFTVRVGDTDFPAPLVGYTTFEKSQNEPGVGTAWLLIVDADERMGKGYDEAQTIAKQFIESMGPQDFVNVIVVSDRQIVADSKWVSRVDMNDAIDLVGKQESTIRSQGRTRPLLDLIQTAASDSFRALGSQKEKVKAPLHQAMVILSSGYGGGDPSTTGPGATKLSEFFTAGRFDDKNTALPKLPTPVISIFFPPKGLPEHQQLAQTFMQNVANPAIGGFFTVVQDGQAGHARRIVDAVRARFSQLIIARFRLSCVAPTTTQSFSLLFKSSAILGDSSFKDVPVGFDPSAWPLDVDDELTRKTAEDQGGVYPGGTVRILGNFCWGGDVARPEAYFLPPGEALPHDLSESPDAAAKVQKRLISLDMRAAATAASANFAEFRLPDGEQLLHGEGERRVVRLVVIDSTLRRTSGLTEATVLTLKGAERPQKYLPYALGAGGGLLLLLVLGLYLRRGTTRSLSIPPGGRTLSESPYATPAPVSRVPRGTESGRRATLEGAFGRFTVLDGSDLRVGRDASRCAAVLASAQVSGLHATFRMEDGHLLVRDEASTSGTKIGSALIEPGVWEEVGDGDEVSLGPEVLRVSLR